MGHGGGVVLDLAIDSGLVKNGAERPAVAQPAVETHRGLALTATAMPYCSLLGADASPATTMIQREPL